MQDYTQAAATSVRQRVTLETLMMQISGLVDQASGLAGDAERVADELCGPVPEAVSDGRPDGPRTGKLDQLSQMLDLVSHHQHRARAASRRVGNVVLGDADINNLGKAIGGATLGPKGGY